MNAHTRERLEFGKVLDRIAARARTAPGQEAARALEPTSDPEAIRTRADRTADAMAVLELGRDFAVERFENPADILERAAIEDAMLAPLELRTVATVLRNAEDLQKVFRRLRADAPTLWKLSLDLVPAPELRDAIEAAIEPDGTVADRASVELRRVRVEMRKVEDRIRSRLEAMVENADVKPFLTGDYVTRRSGRNVIPVVANQAGQVPGIIHDRSDSGATVFLEPQAVVDLGNELRGLASEEQREVRRILRERTTGVRDHLHGLRRDVALLVEFDVLRASARYARAHRMVRPTVAEGGSLAIVAGRHPVLEDTLAEAGEAVVPLDFVPEEPIRTVAVTGANAGGKTVSLKTIGLLALMAHTGLPVPADRGTAFPLLGRILVDIGDEQSIEANLSTFSGHVQHIRTVLAEADRRSLVLLDELGAGTDPIEGGALACACLRALHAAGARTVATTHLSQVKAFVHEQTGMDNAAVEFDPATLRPTFRLVLGRPGASHALTIARRLGLPEEVLEGAEALLDSDALAMEDLLARLTASLRKAEADAAAAGRRREEAEAAQNRLRKELTDVKRERKEALRKAAEEARGLVENTRRQMERALEEARRAGADASRTRHLRRKVEEKREGLRAQSRRLAPRPRNRIPLEDLEPGRRVWVESMRTHGTVTAVDARKGKVSVDAGGLAMEVDASAVLEPDAEGARPERRPPEGRTVVRPTGPVPPEIHLRGQRYEEARRNLETYLHEAALADLGSVRIIHGHGTGALQQMVQEFLAEFPLIESYRFGERGEGGRGVTIATFR